MLRRILNSSSFLGFLIFLEIGAFLSGLFFLFPFGLWTFVDQIFVMGLFYPLSLFLIGIIITTITSFILLAFTIQYRKRGFLKFPNILRFLLSFYILIGVLLVLFLCLAIYGISTEHQRAPQWPPINDPNWKYVITKDNEFYSVHYTTSEDSKSFGCGWINGKKTCQWHSADKDFIGNIASSPVDLEPFVGKSVKLTGKNIYANQQCIRNNCRDMFKSVALRIDSIMLAEN